MALYNLYTGLGGGFGGSSYNTTEDYDTYDQAVEAAYDLAFEEYQSYEGLHGIRSENEIKEEYMEENGIFDESDLGQEDWDFIADAYREEVEGWICYHAVLASEDPEQDMSEEDFANA